MKKIKLTFRYMETNNIPDNFSDVVLLLEDMRYGIEGFIEWTNSQDRTTGTNISKIKRLPNGMIQISFPIFYDDDIDPNPYIISKERFIKFLEDWRDFGKSKKKYIYLKEDGDGWYSFEYPEEKNS